MERRRAIKQIAALSLAGMPMPGCGRQQSEVLGVARDAVGNTRDALTPPACILTPQQTAGPFYLDPRQMRGDITEGRPGIPLRLHLSVVDADRCEPIEAAVVDVWHADAAGLYSGFGAAALDPVTGARPDFMRGVQPPNGRDGIRTERFTSTSRSSWLPVRRQRHNSTSRRNSTTRCWLRLPIRTAECGTGATTMTRSCGPGTSTHCR